MPNTWITDMTHFLDDAGGIVAMPGRSPRSSGMMPVRQPIHPLRSTIKGE